MPKPPNSPTPAPQCRPGSPAYALEELIAELGAAYLCQDAGITSEPLENNTAAYLNSFLQHLQQNKKFLFRAAAAAQRAVAQDIPFPPF